MGAVKPLVIALAPLPPAAWTRRAGPLPFPLSEPSCRLFARARHGLWHGVRAAGLRPGDEVLAPAFHHGSEIEALLRAGLVCRFYEATRTLAPDDDELRALLGPRTRALHLTHYFGFPQDAERWRRWCDERGLLLIEDAAQSWLATASGRPVGSSGDIAIFCLYKTFGLPDGAALVCRTAAAPEAAGRPRLGLRRLGLEHALWLATRSRTLAWAAERRRVKAYVPGDDMALGDPMRPPLRSTLAVLRRVADGAAATARRRNYSRLLELLPGSVLPALSEVPTGASPLVFPFVAGDKRGMLAFLRRRQVRALNIWSTPHPAVRESAFPRAAELRATLVGLPVHQELRDGDIERVAEAVYAGTDGEGVRRSRLEPGRSRGDVASSARAARR